MRSQIALLAAGTSLGFAWVVPCLAATPFSVELRRGFVAANDATRESQHFEEWIGNFERALATGKRKRTNSDAFIAGAQFGFSYRIAEFERKHENIPQAQLRSLVISGTLARLKYEQSKQALGITDAYLVRVLRIPIQSFALWKSGVSTSDNDTSVIDNRRWLQL